MIWAMKIDQQKQDELQEQSRGASNYRNAVRAATRGFWSGALDYDQFAQALESAIRLGIPQAWHEGSKECGVLPSELSPEERLEMQGVIWDEYNYINGFALAIEAGSKANGGKLGPLMSRAEMWIGRYGQTKEKAKSMACADRKAVWIYGDTIEHCQDCSRVVGRVYRISTWDRYGWIPGSNDLACGGWRCKCQRVPTDEPCTPGRPPKLSGA